MTKKRVKSNKCVDINIQLFLACIVVDANAFVTFVFKGEDAQFEMDI